MTSHGQPEHEQLHAHVKLTWGFHFSIINIEELQHLAAYDNMAYAPEAKKLQEAQFKACQHLSVMIDNEQCRPRVCPEARQKLHMTLQMVCGIAVLAHVSNNMQCVVW
jgi:hypothetical protein